MNTKELLGHVGEFWDARILPTLMDYVKIPNESPMFDKDWAKHGHMERAVSLVEQWMKTNGPPDLQVRVLREGKRTPLILAELPGSLPQTVLLYGHLDKQPPMTGWRKGLGPWTPVLDRQGRLYGRGGADDGYSAFAAVALARALKASGQPHARLVMLIECCEESGSPHLPHYLAVCKKQIGSPSLVIALDSGAGNYERLWSTTSLRGLLQVGLKVEVLREGVHSGIAGGIVPSPFRIARLLLDRLEDPATGRILPAELQADIPPARIEQARRAARVLGSAVGTDFPFVKGAQPQVDNIVELLLNNSWRAALTITGQEGIPETGKGGNVLYPSVNLKISLRIPPGVKPGKAGPAIKKLLEADPPHGARVSVSAGGMEGWEAPPLAPWLGEALDAASREIFGKDACHFGLGGTIPFMQMIGDKFPKAQFLITGVLGPHSNAHGPNEFLHVPYAKRLTCCLVRILAAHHDHYAG
ncbi:MAG: M20/M25/M40 family metallo-hydrolase [SAR324 cluster bacterium]|nr:M20/M25/M40 family metallo-hydrolase [SAR324 cluster bacterium]